MPAEIITVTCKCNKKPQDNLFSKITEGNKITCC